MPDENTEITLCIIATEAI